MLSPDITRYLCFIPISNYNYKHNSNYNYKHNSNRNYNSKRNYNSSYNHTAISRQSSALYIKTRLWYNLTVRKNTAKETEL